MNSTYQSYYTKSEPILQYMTGMLNIQENDTILEPCGGDGVFVDKILTNNSKANICIFELNPAAVSTLRNKYRDYGNIKIVETDTLLNPSILRYQKLYDKIIGNPPYGARNNEEKKEELNKLYPNLYTKESYTLFLYACVNCLKEGGELSFIIPDTFLSLHRHLMIRRYLLEHTQIKELSLFPSSFFPGVNFGYANLCIITLKKSSDVNTNLRNQFSIRNGFSRVNDLTDPSQGESKLYYQSDIYSNVDSAFFFNSNDRINELINGIFTQKIGDIASCVTGFYSGNDKIYLRPIDSEVRNAKKYEPISSHEICHHNLSQCERTNGIDTQDCYVAIVKGGNKRYLKPDEWYMNWSTKAISEYRQSKKCRFQNSNFYFKEGGIAIPMIRSSRLTAALINGRLFDQSIVGIYPRRKDLTYYLLAFFNSDVCTRIISAINPSTNNSANYIKKIPFILPSEDILSEVNSIVKNIILRLEDGEDISDYDNRLNEIFDTIYQLD